MRLWMICWSLLVLTLGVFVVANWRVLTAQTELHLIVAQVTAPLGLVLLGAMATLALLFLIFLVWLETQALLQVGSRRLPAGADLAGQASSELRGHLERQLNEFQNETARSLQEVLASVNRLQQTVRERSDRVG